MHPGSPLRFVRADGERGRSGGTQFASLSNEAGFIGRETPACRPVAALRVIPTENPQECYVFESFAAPRRKTRVLGLCKRTQALL